MAFSLLASTSFASNSSGGTTPSIDTTGARLIIIGVSRFNSSSTLPTDSAGNSWSEIAQSNASGTLVKYFYKIDPATSASHTFTYSEFNSFPCITVAAFDAEFAVVEHTSTRENGSGTTAAPGSITPTVQDNLAVLIAASDGQTSTATIDNGFTEVLDTSWNNGVAEGGYLAYKAQNDAVDAFNPTVTFSTSLTHAAVMAVFHDEEPTPPGAGIIFTGTDRPVYLDYTDRLLHRFGGSTVISANMVLQGTNTSGGTLTKGQPVIVAATGEITLAQANDIAGSVVLGLISDDSVPNGLTGSVATCGHLSATTTQWDAVTGQTGGLTAGALYFLSATTAGKLQLGTPTGDNEASAIVGIAANSTDMRLWYTIPVEFDLAGDNTNRKLLYWADGVLTVSGAEFVNTGSGNNVGLGSNALNSVTTGTDNLAVGVNAGTALTTGSQAVLIGTNAGMSLTTDTGMFIGGDAGANVQAGGNTGIGRYAGRGAIIGSGGTNNLSIGTSTLVNVSSGSDNVALGNSAGGALTIGSFNMLIGRFAGSSLNTTSSCVFIGTQAGNNMTGSTNVGIGRLALRGASGATGTDNVGIGNFTGLGLTTGGSNVLVGRDAGRSLTTATQNVFVGDTAGFNASQAVGVTNSVANGYNTFTTASNTVIIGNTSVVSTTLRGDILIDDGRNIVPKSTTGTKIATATTQKIGFYGATPVVRPSNANQAALTDSSGGTADGTVAAVSGSGADATINNNFADVVRLVNQLRNDLVALGLINGA